MNWLVLCCCRFKKGTFGGSWRFPLLPPRKAGPWQSSWGSGIQRVSASETLLAPFLPLLPSSPGISRGSQKQQVGQDVAVGART